MNEPIKMFVIALPRFATRYRHAQAQASRFPELLPEMIGVDGFEPGLVERRSTRASLPGAIGCALSHVEAYRQIVDGGHKRALVIEDDAILPDNLLSLLSKVGRTIRDGEVISLYNRTISVARFSSLDCTTFDSTSFYYPMDPVAVRTTAAYVIDREAAARIAAGNDPVRYLADDWADFYREEWISSIRVMLPSPISITSEDSTIETSSRHDGLKGRFRSIVKSVPLLSPIREIRRRWLLASQERNYVFVHDRSSLSERYGAAVVKKSSAADQLQAVDG